MLKLSAAPGCQVYEAKEQEILRGSKIVQLVKSCCEISL